VVVPVVAEMEIVLRPFANALAGILSEVEPFTGMEVAEKTQPLTGATQERVRLPDALLMGRVVRVNTAVSAGPMV